MKASFEQATGVIRQLSESNEKLQAERGLLRVKIVESAEQQEKTTALLNKTNMKRKSLVEESVDALKQSLDTTEPIAARRRD